MPRTKRNLLTAMRKGADPLTWNPLDNAAKIFPPTSHGADSGVFRLSAELNETVDPSRLQQALDQTLQRFPHMQMVLRRGLFWYYLEQSTLHPQVTVEHAPLCAPLYHGSRSLLFEISYWRSKINLELYHVLADGSGAMEFFRALIIRYLILSHPEIEIEDEPISPAYARGEDSFRRYYQKGAKNYNIKPPRAHHIRGPLRSEGGLSAIEGVAPVKKVLEAAHRYQATLTVYLCAVLAQAIYQEMYLSDRSRPVVLTVPVNLRGFFPSDSGRNFFGTFPVSYDFSGSEMSFEEIVRLTARAFEETLTEERVSRRMNQLAALEHQPFIRAIPLFLKNPVMRLAGWMSDRSETAVLSNVGRFELPEPLQPFLKGVGLFMSTHALQLCTISSGAFIHFGFTSAFSRPAIQRRFFTRLIEDGIDIEIRSSEHHLEESHA